MNRKKISVADAGQVASTQGGRGKALSGSKP
jgi:hypothetical protein